MTEPTRPQKTKLAVIREQRFPDRDAWFRWVENVIGRQVTSNRELTEREAMALIDELKSAAHDQPDDYQ